MRSTPLVLVMLLASAVRAEPDDPKALLATGLAHERAGDWIAARHVYEKLALAKGFADQALYLQAFSALQAGEDDAAMTLATKAIAGASGYQNQARFVYGDALFHRGDFKRAKDFFIQLRDRSTGDAKTIASAKLVACEHMIDPSAVAVAAAPTPTPTAPKSTATDGASLYRDAMDAFQRGDNNEALSLAERAAKLTGPHQLHAKVLYGDALFRNGEYARAKTIYIALLASVTGDARVAVTKKIVVCNTKLNLPERDGVPAP